MTVLAVEEELEDEDAEDEMEAEEKVDQNEVEEEGVDPQICGLLPAALAVTP